MPIDFLNRCSFERQRNLLAGGCLLLGGYETTSVLMSFFFYVMATKPAIQENVYEEIRREIGDVGNRMCV